MEAHKITFLEKSLLGREINFEDSEEVIRKCIKLAYGDMLSAGRYYISNDMDSRCNTLKTLLEKRDYIYSRNIIEELLPIFGDAEKIGEGNKYVTRYGLAQKFVNMTYKYLYVFNEHIHKEIDFSKCDCPIDSVILSKFPNINYVWSKLTAGEYIHCQTFITGLLQKENLDTELTLIGNLAYDFINW